MMPLPTKYHFTQLSLLSQIFLNFLKKQKPSINLLSSCSSPQQDIYIWQLISQTPNNESIHYQIKMIQIQFIIKIFIIQLQHKNQQLGQQSLRMGLDQVWISYRKYLPKRINNGYLCGDVGLEGVGKLEDIFRNRVIPIFPKPSQHPSSSKSPTNQQILLEALTNNLIIFNQYLRPKQYANLEQISSQTYKLLHKQENYKAIYEERWGRTGFELEERNWVAAYRNKVKNLRAMGKI